MKFVSCVFGVLGFWASAAPGEDAVASGTSRIAEGVLVDRPSPWVDVRKGEAGERALEEHPAGGVNYLSVKHHFRPADDAVYSRIVLDLRSESGVDENSTLYWNYDPDFEEIRLHWIRLRRDGEVLDVLPKSRIDVVDARTEMSSWFYDDSKDIRIILGDVRVGDVLDYAYTRVGSNPVVGERFSNSASLGYGVPVGRIEVRLDWPEGEPEPAYRTHPSVIEPDISEEGTEKVYRWLIEESPPYRTADGTPPGYGPPWVEFSDWENWAEVAAWAVDLYRTEGPLPGWIAEAVGEIREKNLPPLETATRVLQLIQDSIRYVAIPVGPHSYQPYSPERIAKRRYGDCKDMSQLLVMALSELGIEAEPVLVNSYESGNISRWLPSPTAFDHVVVGADIEGRRVWMDPTFSYQGGILPERYFPDYGVGLPVDRDTKRLERGVGPQGFDQSLVESTETLAFEHYRAPIRLAVETRYAGDEADLMRERIAANGLDSVEREFANYYTEVYGGMIAKEALEVSDDREENVLILREAYTIPSVFGEIEEEPGYWTFSADQIADRISVPVERIREQPYGLYLPNRARQTIRLRLPDDSVFAPEEEVVETDWFRYSLEVSQEGRILELAHEIEFLQGKVATDDIDAYIDAVEEVLEWVDYPIEVEGTAVAGNGLIGGLMKAFRESPVDPSPSDADEPIQPTPQPDRSPWPLAITLIILAFIAGLGVGKKISLTSR